MQFDEARKRLREVRSAYDVLGAALDEVENQLSSLECSPDANGKKLSPDLITSQSTPDQKLTLYMQLFAGRTDTYAQRWESSKTGHNGYQPVCSNQWKTGLCLRSKVSCRRCAHRALVPLDSSVMIEHLKGNKTIGIYPLLEDDLCNFIVADFDDNDFRDDACAFSRTCDDAGITCAIEVSRSGKGAHGWIFFEAPIAAVLARKVATILITRTMEREDRLTFASYDRLFPSQDLLPIEGFGNLIALPLQGESRKLGATVFVDYDFLPVPDQWEYLASLKKVEHVQVESVLASGKGKELGVLGSAAITQLGKPAQAQERVTLDASDFAGTTVITISNMVRIEKDGLSQRAIQCLRRLATFSNPDFVKAQAMRLPTYDKPRVITAFEEDDAAIGLGRGLLEDVCEILVHSGAAFEIKDLTNHGTVIQADFISKLRPEQKRALSSLVKHENGVLAATTAFGKTVVAAALIAQIRTNTLVLVHSRALISQWQEALLRHVQFDPFVKSELEASLQNKRGRKRNIEVVGTISGGKDDTHGIVDVATFQSLARISDTSIVSKYGLVIVDECHHVSAVSFEKVLKQITAYRVYGLTATPKRADGHDPLIFMQCGHIRHIVNAKLQARKRSFSHKVVTRFTAFGHTLSFDSRQIQKIFQELAISDERNALIVGDIIDALNEGRHPVVLTERTAHVKELSRLLEDQGVTVLVLTGSMGLKQRRVIEEQIKNLEESENTVLVATGKYIGEGFDCPVLDTLFLALPISWEGKLAQYVGRLHRDFVGKESVQVFDYVDVAVPVLERMYKKRLKGYRDLGYEISLLDLESQQSAEVLSGKRFTDAVMKQIDCAKRSVLISSPRLSKKQFDKLIPLLLDASRRGVEVRVVVGDYEKKKTLANDRALAVCEELQTIGITVVHHEKAPPCFVVIDGCKVWYGTAGLLESPRYDSTVLYIESFNAADSLKATLE